VPDADDSPATAPLVVKDAGSSRKHGAYGPIARDGNGKLSFVNGAGAELRAELSRDFPGIDLDAVLNKAAGQISARTPAADYPAKVRSYCQYAKDDLVKSGGGPRLSRPGYVGGVRVRGSGW
jgi:hypothetical protein